MLMIDRTGVFETSIIIHRTTRRTITQYRRHSRELASGAIHSPIPSTGVLISPWPDLLRVGCILCDGENISFDASLVIYRIF